MDIKKIIQLLKENCNSQIDDIVWQLYEEREHFEKQMIILQTQNLEMANTIQTLQNVIQSITNKKDLGGIIWQKD